ncbi:hypothetical protein [Nocardia blacklockiae]|uniref:hypothetical protein n=1 Tax=Nocardia blacklockiae TaxID=480036 RepID=UPI00189599B8|nr:hypothetical protein [Nocardia blacklockiae]MBF6174922.1 hypothetical protein [Nocardia blacklockiae]
MSPRPTLLISQIENWNTGVLATDATTMAELVTKADEMLHSMLTTQDDLAESWRGAGADAAAARVVSEKTAGSHIVGQISNLRGAYTTHQTALTDAKNLVVTKRNLFRDTRGFDVRDDGTVTAETKIRQLEAAGKDRGDVAGARIDLMYEAGQCQLELLSALQNADNAATAARTQIELAKAELGRVALSEAPSKEIRALFSGPAQPGTAAPAPSPIVGEAWKLQQGIPITLTNPDGSVKTVTPNPDGTITVATSAQQPDGSILTTETTGTRPPVTTVATSRSDGSGIVDLTVTTADGTGRQLRKFPENGGITSTFAVGADGSQIRVSSSYPLNGGTVTDRYGANGVIDRQWERPDGFRAFEQYVPAPDGKPMLVGTANSAGMQSVQNPDGTITTFFPDGRTAHTEQFADGRIITKFPDGSMLDFDPAAAPPGTPRPTVWDTTKAWTETQWISFADSTGENVTRHPWMTAFSGATAAGGEMASRAAPYMAEQVQHAVSDSYAHQVRALDLLDSGTPGAGHAFVGAMDSATDAASKAQFARWLEPEGRFLGGWPLGAAVNAYVNWDDWKNYGKPFDEAAANTVGSTVGGSAGAWGGALVGMAVCAPATPIGQAFCAGIGAGLAGFAGGAFGGWAAEQPFK